ncbi:MAG TPA: serine hydrolase, partial [Candidatus Baltobacteraceae bacterium]|nr:serine hydrolase [Candidatus Baltobacteraceae bacterium]
YTLGLPMADAPGTRALYCSAGINLLGAIVATETHAPLGRYFDEHFAVPMQFQNYEMWLMPKPPGEAYMAGGDRFRPRDFLKFGALLLNHGQWNGRKIVGAAWIAQSVVPRTAPEGEGDRYGYGWHLTTVTVDGRNYGVINAGGNGGQLMVVIPSLDLAMMITAGNYNQFPVWRTFLPKFVTAVVQSIPVGSDAAQ